MGKRTGALDHLSKLIEDVTHLPGEFQILAEQAEEAYDELDRQRQELERAIQKVQRIEQRALQLQDEAKTLTGSLEGAFNDLYDDAREGLYRMDQVYAVGDALEASL